MDLKRGENKSMIGLTGEAEASGGHVTFEGAGPSKINWLFPEYGE